MQAQSQQATHQQNRDSYAKKIFSLQFTHARANYNVTKLFIQEK